MRGLGHKPVSRVVVISLRVFVLPPPADVQTWAAQAHLQSAAGWDHAGGQERGAEADGRAGERVVQPALGLRGL